MLAVLLIGLGALLILAGLVGCILPVIPGPPLSFLGLLSLYAARDWDAASFTGLELALVGVAAVLVTIVDTAAPAIGAKRWGASRGGVWGCIAGMLAGMIWFPPFGMILGAWVGAFAAEVIVGLPWGQAFKASFGVFVYTMLGVGLKVLVSLWAGYLFVVELAGRTAPVG